MSELPSGETSGACDAESGLRDSHVRHVVSTFRHLDELLEKAERIISSAGSRSLFPEYTDDTTPIQRKVTHDYVSHIREMMSRSLEDLRIRRPEAVAGALWAARNAVAFTHIALTEMESRHMGGYGQLSDDAARRIDAIVAELRSGVGRLDNYLAQSGGVDLPARLQRLEETSSEARLLRELERMITAHGLVEFRNAVGILLERMENGTFEIGVFGRVSSGKSSLLNRLLGGDYLPVGVTPVTAVPTHIRFGRSQRVLIEFADSRPQMVGLSGLAEFAAEQQNPANVKHVSRIRAEVPAARLGEGITFVDTPGLGSLATSGAEETVAYLPRCDLGIVLVDAASTLTREDLKVVHAIDQAGASAMVLISKADLLNPSDRNRALDYVRNQIRSEVGMEPAAHLVSVVGNDANLCDEWFESQLQPLLVAHRELAAASLRRKVAGLREALLATLKRRSETRATTLSENQMERAQQVERELRSVPQILQSARHEAEEQARTLPEVERLVVERAADELAVSWSKRGSQTVDPGDAFTTTVIRLVTERAAKVRQHFNETRRRLAELLQAASRLFPSSGLVFQELPKPDGLPLPDPSALADEVTLRRPTALSLLGTAALRRHIRTRLGAQVSSQLHDSLDVYSRRLTQWVMQSFSELDSAFVAAAGIFSAQLGRYQPSAPEEASNNGLQNDILLLETWGEFAEPGTRTVNH